MGNNSFNTMPNIIFLSTLSASVVSLSYGTETLISQANYHYIYQYHIDNWIDSVFVQGSKHQFFNQVTERTQALIDFSKRLIDNTKDIDSEFVNVVNENFWELI